MACLPQRFTLFRKRVRERVLHPLLSLKFTDVGISIYVHDKERATLLCQHCP